MGYLSTQATIEARILAMRLDGMIDFDADGDPDALVLESLFKFSRGIIRGKLVKMYGETEIDTWDIDVADTVPELVGQISDDLCIYRSISTNPLLTETADKILTNSLQLLDMIASGDIALYGVTPPTYARFEAVRMPSDFDPERELDDMTVRTTWVTPDDRELEDY